MNNISIKFNFIKKLICECPDGIIPLIEGWAPTDIINLIDKSNNEIIKSLLHNLNPKITNRVLSGYSIEKNIYLLNMLDKFSCMLIIKAMPSDKANNILENLNKNTCSFIKQHLIYNADAVGSWSELDCTRLYPDMSIHDVRTNHEIFSEKIHSVIYVTNRKNKLIGYVDTKQLLTADTTNKISSLYKKLNYFLSPQSKLITIANHHGWQLFDILPVVNNQGLLLGTLSVGDMRRGIIHNIPGYIERNTTTNSSYGIYGNTLISLLRA